MAARSGRAAIDAGGAVSLHSPAGPVSLLTGGHVTASIPGSMPLEHAVHEVDWRADLLALPERIEDGRLHIPASAGLGAELDWRLIQRIGRVWDAHNAADGHLSQPDLFHRQRTMPKPF